MSRYPFKLCLLFLAVVLGFCVVLLRPVPEPVWKGRTLGAWIDDFMNGSSKEVRDPAEEAIRSIGPAAVPSLLRMLRARPTLSSRVREQLNRKQNFVRFKWTSAGGKHWRGLLGFRALGEAGEIAIPQLGRMLVEEPNVELVPEALSAISAKCVPVLLEAVPRVPPERRYSLLVAALKWPSQEKAIVSALKQSLADSDGHVRAYAVSLLGHCRSNPTEVIPALVAALNDPEYSVRVQALATVGDFGTDAAAALPAIEKLARDPGFILPSVFSNALSRIQPPSQ